MTLFFFFRARSTLRLKINLTPVFKQSRLPVSGKENSRNTVYGYKKTWSAHISVVAVYRFLCGGVFFSNCSARLWKRSFTLIKQTPIQPQRLNPVILIIQVFSHCTLYPLAFNGLNSQLWASISLFVINPSCDEQITFWKLNSVPAEDADS